MQEKEKIPVYVDVGKNGKTKCICAMSRKGCGKVCSPDLVTRDRFYGWRESMNRDKYGRSRDAPVELPPEIKKLLRRSDDL